MSWKNFFLINSAICGLAYCRNLLGVFFGEIFVITSLLRLVNIDKPQIGHRKAVIERCPGELKMYVLQACIVKSLTHYFLLREITTDFSFSTLPFFILKSFLFEIIFDGLHYCVHRASHTYPILYRFHKVHHKFIHPTAITTFYIHPIDLFLSYSMPLAISTKLLSINRWEFYLITTYLTYVEIAGHLGKKMYPTSSFPQCIWLPRFLNIQLYTEDHDLHHTHFNYNYAKRFSFWDKIFGTYKSGIKL